MTNKEKIREEVIRLRVSVVDNGTPINDTLLSAYNNVLSFIDSLPTENVDLWESDDLWEAKQIYYEELNKEHFDGDDVCNAFVAGWRQCHDRMATLQ